MKWALLFIGGGSGAVLRVLLSSWVSERAGAHYPWGTFAVNALGCLAIGMVLEWAALRGALSPEARSLVVAGFLGGFTTFSAFGYETLSLAGRGDAWLAAAHAAGSVAAGVLAVLLGVSLVRGAVG